jgi:hypothetical protein
MAYTPELTKSASGTLRRIAWAAGLPMTKTINSIFGLIPKLFNKEVVCNACRDKTNCEFCGFGKARELENTGHQDPDAWILDEKEIRVETTGEESVTFDPECLKDYDVQEDSIDLIPF